MAYGYGNKPTIADSASPRDDIARALMAIQDPPPGGIHMPPGGIPPNQQAPGQNGPPPPGGVGAQMQLPGMLGQMPQMQPAALGAAAPPSGPMGSIGGPYQPQVRLPGIPPRF